MYCLSILALLVSFPANASQLILAQNGISEYVIVIGDQASASEKYAAEEFQRFFSEITGVTLPIVKDTEPARTHEVILGNNQRLRQIGVTVDIPGLGEEGYIILTKANRLILAGSPKRGTLYAVYAFLEDQLGCRWFTPDVSQIPRKETINIPPLEAKHVPIFEYRSVGWISAQDTIWAARNRVNTGIADEIHGGGVSILGGVHNFHSILPPDRYFSKHPEYYPVINGKRVYQNAQLCMTNPDVVRLVTAELKNRLEQNPGTSLIGLGQEDWGGWCECPDCKVITEREESQAGLLLHFVNAVADGLAKDYPDLSIVTLAYQNTRKPPKRLKPRPNVIPWLCGIECCYSHPIATCEINASYYRDLADWALITNKLYIFDYTANFEHYVMPHPNLRVLQPNIQLFAEKGVRGVYASGNTGAGSELGELRAYLLARLLWNPHLDVDQARREFMAAYYGKAAKPLEEYIRLMHDKVETENIHATIVAGPRMPYLAPEMISRARVLFDEAERLADDKTILERVKVARLAIQHVELEWMKPGYYFDEGFYKPILPSGAEELARTFVEVAERNGVAQIFEMNGPKAPSWHLDQLKLWQKQWPAVRLENDILRVDVVPGWGGRVSSIFQKRKGWELLLPGQPDGREYPKSGGIEEYSERGGRTAGWDQEYDFRIVTPGRTVIMWTRLPNGLQFERTVELSPDKPQLTLYSKLTNATDEPRNACLRSNPKFQLGATNQVTVRFQTVGGTDESIRLEIPEGKMREALTLSGERLPRGVWEATNSDLGITLKQTFRLDEVQTCILDWLPSKARFFMELQTAERTLAPRESLVLTQTFDIATE